MTTRAQLVLLRRHTQVLLPHPVLLRPLEHSQYKFMPIPASLMHTRGTPIYNQMTGHGNTSSTTGTGTGTSTSLGGERHAGHTGTDGPIGGARVAGATGDNTSLGDSSRLGDDSRHGGNTRPAVSSGTYDGNSEASIKSGVIGFAPGSGGQGHAALPSSNSAEDRLDRNQVVGQGTTGTNTGSGLRNETIPEQPSTLPGR